MAPKKPDPAPKPSPAPAPAPQQSAPASRPAATAPSSKGSPAPSSQGNLPKATPNRPSAPVQTANPNRPQPAWDSRLGFKGPQGAGYRPSTSGASASTAAAESDDSGDGGNGAANYDAEETRRNTNSIAILRGLLGDYGLDSLMNTVIGYVQDGYDPDAVMVLIRQTPEYKQRFPAMENLAAKKRTISEASYIEFERNAAQLERLYGLPAGMLGKDAVTNLLSNEVSANELENRVTLAASAAFQAAPEVRNALKDYYNIDSGGLTSYFLDPQRAMPLLNKQYVSAQLGAEAAMQGIGIDRSMAEMLNERGVSTADAQQGFSQVAGLRSLSSGLGEQVSQNELIKGNLLSDQEAAQSIGRVQKSRTGRFEGGGSYAGSTSGVQGLGSSNA